MEKTKRGVVVPVEMDWSDVGAWDAVWKLSPRRTDNNAVSRRRHRRRHAQLAFSVPTASAMVAALGLDDMAVIAVRDAVFVAPMDRVSDVKDACREAKGR